MSVSRRRLALVVTLASIGGGLGLLFWLAPTPRINRDAYRDIRAGMSEDEVASVLGVPPGDYRTLDVLYGYTGLDDVYGAQRVVRSSEWRGNEGMVMVGFDANGRVVGKTYMLVGRRSYNPVPMLRRLLRW